MNIWQTLEIETTPDTKAIKRAYAKKLKVTRPDEDPKGFQDLHYAYKAALQHAEWMARREAEGDYDEYEDDDEEVVTALEVSEANNSIELPTESATELLTQSTSEKALETLESHSQENPDETPASEIPVNPLQLEGDRLLGLTQLFLSASDEAQNNPKNWQFIIESPYILEDHFNWRLGLELLQTIHQYNVNHVAKVQRLVGQDALNYLNSIFNWSENRQHILRALGDEYATWLDMIKDPVTESQQNWQSKIRGGKKLTVNDTSHNKEAALFAKPWQRFSAGCIDVIIISLFISALYNDNKQFPYFLSFFGFALIYFLFFESSQLQGSIGKRIMGLKVVNLEFDAINFPRSLLRLSSYIGYFLLLSVAITLISIPLPFVGGFGFIYFIYTLVKPITEYDRWSKTRVIKT